MASAVDRHLALLDDAIVSRSGVHFKTVGDAVQAAFPTAPDAVAAALAAQKALLSEDWGTLDPLRVRMALHAGEAIPDDRGDYLAAPLNRLARLLAIGHGGQVLLSQAVQQLVRDSLPADAGLRDLGGHRLRDLLEPEQVAQHPDLPADFRHSGRLAPGITCHCSPRRSWDGKTRCGRSPISCAVRRPPSDTDRTGRQRQDPLGVTGRRGLPRRLLGWRLLRGSGAPHQPGFGAIGDCCGARSP